jgi:hypothetical protein
MPRGQHHTPVEIRGYRHPLPRSIHVDDNKNQGSSHEQLIVSENEGSLICCFSNASKESPPQASSHGAIPLRALKFLQKPFVLLQYSSQA